LEKWELKRGEEGLTVKVEREGFVPSLLDNVSNICSTFISGRY
jgi:hypothetical protein